MTKNCIPYKIVLPKNKKVGILLSIPHSGTNFPQELSTNYNKQLSAQPDDTDWYLEKLYDFAAELGITTIQALNSRWVIDLNRNPENTSLYDDGRIITALCPTTDFLGQQIYINKKAHPSKSEVQRRLETYYWPYHHKIDELIKSLKNEFNRVILWDAHSIRRKVETIQNDPFPDLILGNNDRKTADNELINKTLNQLKKSNLTVKDNHPFKGGYITRSKGDLTNNVHALQLEMAKDLYMKNNELDYDNQKADKIKLMLKDTFKTLITYLDENP